MGLKKTVNKLLGSTHYRLVNLTEYNRLYAARDAGIDAASSQRRGIIDDLTFLLPPDSTRMILDVGANVGATYRLFRSLYPQAFIHAFEPDVRLRDKWNGFTASDGKLAYWDLAVSDSARELTFHISDISVTNSLFPATPDINLPSPQEVKVQSVTLDAFTAEHNTGPIDLLKLDVEEAEMLVLRGAERLLTERCVKCLYVELRFSAARIGGCTPLDIMAHLRDKGYVLHGFYNLERLPETHRLAYCDALFVQG